MKLGDFLCAVSYSEECAECSSPGQQGLLLAPRYWHVLARIYLSTGEQMSPLKTQQSYTIFLEGNKGRFGKDLLTFICLADQDCPLKASSWPGLQ